jgi:hypothetical protein
MFTCGEVVLDFDVIDNSNNELDNMNKGKEGASYVYPRSSDDEHLRDDIVIVLDCTGIKITNRGEWLPHKWNVRKGYLKIHVTVDIKKKKIV